MTNLSVAQIPGTKTMRITYDVASTETNVASISLRVINGTSPIECPSVSGDVGEGIPTGTGKLIFWDSGADWDGNVGELEYYLIISDVPEFPVLRTGQTTSFCIDDDGNLQAGLVWAEPRFTNHGDGTVTDNTTGLMWIQQPDSSGFVSWDQAFDFCDSLSLADHTDWRMPSIKELLSLIDYEWGDSSMPFGRWTYSFWSSTTYAGNTNRVWKVNVASQMASIAGKNDFGLFAWAVRGGIEPEVAGSVLESGQAISYRSGDDGDLRPGASWPELRFVDNLEGTVTDMATGLQWIKEPHLLPGNDGPDSWYNLVDFCSGLVFASHSDWRLPNAREMASLANFGQPQAFSWLNSPGAPFSGIKPALYWTSTTDSERPNEAFFWNSYAGDTRNFGDPKSHTGAYYAWPVRGKPDEIPLFSERRSVVSDTRNYTLAIGSKHGNPVPDGVQSNYCWLSTVTCSVDYVVYEGGTNWNCIGWKAIGSSPEMGTTNQAIITLTNHNSTVVWNWHTNYWVNLSMSGSGSVNRASNYYPAGTNFSLSAASDYGWLFMGWSGDLSGDYTASNATLLVDAPKSVTATFSNDADGDGLLNTNETAIGTDPRNGDSDGDGFDDEFEVGKGLSPLENDSDVIAYIDNHTSVFDRYPSNAVLDVAVGQMLLETDGTNAALRIQLEQSEDLQSWANAGDALEWTVPVNSEKRFFRVRTEP